MVRVAIDAFVTITRVRAQWSQRAHIAGESDFCFMLPAAEDDPLGLVWSRWQTYLQVHFRAARATAWLLERVIVEDIWPGERAALVNNVNLSPIPPFAGPGTPGQVSPVISWRTGDPGRSNRGRTYMGPYTLESAEDDNVVDPGLSAVYDFAEAMINRFGPGTLPGLPRFVILSRQEDGMPIVPGAYCLVETYYFLERWATQRRRMVFDWRT